MSRRLTAFAAAAALAGAACSQQAPEQPAAPEEPQAAPVSTAPSVGFACESGATLQVQYADNDSANVTYRNQAYALRSVQSASGARYVGAGVEWWTATRDGQESGTLSRLGPDGQTGVAVLERCSRPIPGAEAAPGPIPTPGRTPTPAAGGVLPAALPCKAPQLKLEAGEGDAGAGNRVRNFSLQNIGTQACSLTGYPVVTLQDARGRAVTSIRAEQSPGSYFRQGQAPTPVELAPQARAWFEMAWNVVPNETMQKTCPDAATVKVTAPSDTAALSLPFALTPCGGRIRVSPIRAEAAPQPAT
jgi:membrane-bound inhibitor of C-type lysozyme